jgi:hypothetical protein
MSDMERVQSDRRVRKIVILTLAITIPLSMALVLFGARFVLRGLGDSLIDFKGVMYEWVDAPAGSNGLIYVGESLDTDAILEGKNVQPLDVADTRFTTMYGSGDELRDFHDITSSLYTNRPRNAFRFNDVGNMPHYLSLKVERPGYKTLVSEEVSAGGHYSVVILMVGENH